MSRERNELTLHNARFEMHVQVDNGWNRRPADAHQVLGARERKSILNLMPHESLSYSTWSTACTMHERNIPSRRTSGTLWSFMALRDINGNSMNRSASCELRLQCIKIY